MSGSSFSHYVLVDFENISQVDLALLKGRSVHVTLFLGREQTRLDPVLVDRIREAGEQVAQVRLTGSGRNALDLTLSYHLGRLLRDHPEAQFSVLSGDKDFDPLLEYLLQGGCRVSRCEKFSGLPFFPRARKPAATRRDDGGVSSPRKVPTSRVCEVPAAGATPALSPAEGETLENLCRRLRENLGPRPGSLARLLAHINTSFGGRLSEAAQLSRLELLKRRGIVVVDAQGGVSYPPAV